MTQSFYKYPRLYVIEDLSQGLEIELDQSHLHYLRNVLRRQEDDFIRLFNGRDGEWLVRIVKIGKKICEVKLEELIKAQPEANKKIHLFFAPIKKQKMDFLIEKSVELGVSELHPVITSRTVNRKINKDRMYAQTIEAAEQCERMDIPVFNNPVLIDELFEDKSLSDFTPLYACVERMPECQLIDKCYVKDHAAFLVGPEGGFDDDEIKKIKENKQVVPISLGNNILRAETASIVCLAKAL